MLQNNENTFDCFNFNHEFYIYLYNVLFIQWSLDLKKMYIQKYSNEKQNNYVLIFCKLQSLDFKALTINAARFLRIICDFTFLNK